MRKRFEIDDHRTLDIDFSTDELTSEGAAVAEAAKALSEAVMAWYGKHGYGEKYDEAAYSLIAGIHDGMGDFRATDEGTAERETRFKQEAA